MANISVSLRRNSCPHNYVKFFVPYQTENDQQLWKCRLIFVSLVCIWISKVIRSFPSQLRKIMLVFYPLSKHLCKKDASFESSGHENGVWSGKTHLSQGSGRMYLPLPSDFCFRAYGRCDWWHPNLHLRSSDEDLLLQGSNLTTQPTVVNVWLYALLSLYALCEKVHVAVLAEGGLYHLP